MGIIARVSGLGFRWTLGVCAALVFCAVGPRAADSTTTAQSSSFLPQDDDVTPSFLASSGTMEGDSFANMVTENGQSTVDSILPGALGIEICPEREERCLDGTCGPCDVISSGSSDLTPGQASPDNNTASTSTTENVTVGTAIVVNDLSFTSFWSSTITTPPVPTASAPSASDAPSVTTAQYLDPLNFRVTVPDNFNASIHRATDTTGNASASATHHEGGANDTTAGSDGSGRDTPPDAGAANVTGGAGWGDFLSAGGAIDLSNVGGDSPSPAHEEGEERLPATTTTTTFPTTTTTTTSAATTIPTTSTPSSTSASPSEVTAVTDTETSTTSRYDESSSSSSSPLSTTTTPSSPPSSSSPTTTKTSSSSSATTTTSAATATAVAADNATTSIPATTTQAQADDDNTTTTTLTTTTTTSATATETGKIVTDSAILPDEQKNQKIEAPIKAGTDLGAGGGGPGEGNMVDDFAGSPDAGAGGGGGGWVPPPSPASGDFSESPLWPTGDGGSSGGVGGGDVEETPGGERGDKMDELQVVFLVAPCIGALLAVIGVICVIRCATANRRRRQKIINKMKKERKAEEKRLKKERLEQEERERIKQKEREEKQARKKQKHADEVHDEDETKDDRRRHKKHRKHRRHHDDSGDDDYHHHHQHHDNNGYVSHQDLEDKSSRSSRKR